MMRWRTVVAAVMVAAGLVSAVGCEADGLDTLRLSIDGESALGVHRTGVPVQGLVVFFHGLDRDQSILEADAVHRELTATLTEAGYAVVASSAGGNAFGNTLSQNHYQQLIFGAAEHYRTNQVFFLAESMGTLAAVNLMATNADLGVRGLAAINPLLDTDSLQGGYHAQALSANPRLNEVNPLRIAPAALAGMDFRFYVTADDALVPTSRNAAAFVRRFGGTSDISVVTCTGEHMDPSCIQGKDIVRWFNNLSRR
ncbi:hypothetical protein BCA37_20855 [Mycobacterium sp. djl-10]|nr:hypothetical protein BCA37_20855 [Mycobacterium sp. djl-10]